MPSVFGPRPRGILSGSWIDRRGFVIGAGATGAALGAGLGAAYSQALNAPDYLRIAPLRLELAPGKVIDTFAYNGAVPGPVLRFREGQQVNIDVTNNTDIEDIVHWHGLHLPAWPTARWKKGRQWSSVAARSATASRPNRRDALVSQP